MILFTYFLEILLLTVAVIIIMVHAINFKTNKISGLNMDNWSCFHISNSYITHLFNHFGFKQFFFNANIFKLTNSIISLTTMIIL